MPFKASRCAVIGAGVSGLTSAKHLKAAGVEVVVYERSSVSGGVWLVQFSARCLSPRLIHVRSYTERRPLEPSYPALRPSVADFVADPDAKVSIQKSPVDEQNGAQVDPQVTEDIDLVHAPPG
jgi:cation diffusion facilitator CzcD-associated flavoprotein CzcO